MIEEEKEIITIAVKRSIHKRLEKRKIHPNQSFDEVIEELLNLTSTNLKPK